MAQVSEINGVVAEIAAGAHEQSTALDPGYHSGQSDGHRDAEERGDGGRIDGGQSFPVGRKREACRPDWALPGRPNPWRSGFAQRTQEGRPARLPTAGRVGRDPMRVRSPLFSRPAPHRRRSSTARPTTRTAGKNSDPALHRRSRDRDARRRLDWVRLRQERGANLAPRRPPLLVQGVFQWRRSFVPAIATTDIGQNSRRHRTGGGSAKPPHFRNWLVSKKRRRRSGPYTSTISTPR